MKISVVIPNYNNSSLIAKCLYALINQKLDGNHTFQVIVVDDGSTDNSADLISDKFGNNINLIQIPTNQGRSTARNIGAKSSDADYLIFIDSDCIPTDTQFIQHYLNAIQCGGGLIFGQVSTTGNSFWDKLQTDTFKNRKYEFEAGRQWAYTTQNVCIDRKLFLKVDGFDLIFDRHGFEDRDLFIRLLEAGANVTYCETANVIHDDCISLESVSDKMYKAGLHSAKPFRTRHPGYYSKTLYSKIDADIHPSFHAIDYFTWPISKILVKYSHCWIECKYIPFTIRKLMAKCAYALHYLHGTVESKA